MRRRQAMRLVLVAVMATWAESAIAEPFTEGNLVVVQIDSSGLSGGIYSGSAGRVSLVEFTATPESAPVQILDLPTEVVGSNKRLTIPPGAFRAGHLNRSSNGLFLVLGGYDAEVGMPEVSGQDPAVVNRVIGLVDASGAVNTETGLTDCYYGGKLADFRMVATADGTTFWLAGKDAVSSSNACTRFARFGETTSLRIDEDKRFKDPRCVNIFDGQLYVSAHNVSGVSGNQGVSRFGGGLPEVPVDQSELVNIAPSPESTESSSPYDFFFVDENTLYLADDRTEPGEGGLAKFVRDPVADTWTHVYTLNAGLAGGDPAMQLLRSVTGTKDPSGNPVLYATTAEDAGSNRLVAVTDTGPDSEFTTLQTAPAGMILRGVEWAPRPCVGEECVGACCMAEGLCAETTADSCDGVWMGLGSTCDSVVCPLICYDPFADADGDADVDQDDFGAFQACFTGAAGGGPVDGVCACFDRPEPGFPDGDGDIDELDLDAFEACASGPEIAADTTCDDPVEP